MPTDTLCAICHKAIVYSQLPTFLSETTAVCTCLSPRLSLAPPSDALTYQREQCAALFASELLRLIDRGGGLATGEHHECKARDPRDPEAYRIITIAVPRSGYGSLPEDLIEVIREVMVESGFEDDLRTRHHQLSYADEQEDLRRHCSPADWEE